MSMIAAIKDDTAPGTWIQVVYVSGRFVFGIFAEKFAETLIMSHPESSESLIYVDGEHDKGKIEYILVGPMACTYWGQFQDALARERERIKAANEGNPPMPSAPTSGQRH